MKMTLPLTSFEKKMLQRAGKTERKSMGIKWTGEEFWYTLKDDQDIEIFTSWSRGNMTKEKLDRITALNLASKFRRMLEKYVRTRKEEHATIEEYIQILTDSFMNEAKQEGLF